MNSVFTIITEAVGIPQLFWYGELGSYNVLAMEVLGPSLEDLFNQCKRRFSVKCAVLLAEQMVALS